MDCSRWTNLGLKHLLAEGGFGFDDIEVWSWGNKAVARAPLNGWPRMGWRRKLPPDDQRCLVQVWALARRGA